MVISRSIPPDTAAYSALGGLGSLEVIFVMCISPILPAKNASFTAAKLSFCHETQKLWQRK